MENYMNFRRTSDRHPTIECPVVSSDVVPSSDDYVVQHRESLWAREDSRTTSTCLPCVSALNLSMGEEEV